MRRIAAAEYLRMPWRNGGGSTAEIVVEPPGATGRFLYRVSIADVAGDGPFSRFQGYDRHIVLIAGAGMTLEGTLDAPIELTPFEPRSFSGDADVTASLAGGPVRDLNLIVDRARARSSLEVRRIARAETLADVPDTCIVHVIEGALEEAGEGETLLACREPLVLTPRSQARVAIARVELR